ncbi:hypothetical protein AB2M62_18555 [Sphingomonas sp. MMS12-HWE2-04]|uniref:hypothetical protein n=1 Tax=Sphingomonas sp. MMS12-HWE2-04 TaxID=3234199 RepID=UPI00384F0F89
MLIVWSGWGALTILIVAVVSIAVGALLQVIFTALGYPQLAFLAVSIGLFSAAAANWFIGKRLNSTPGRELVDPKTGQSVMLTKRHKLFWIRMEYWSLPVAVLALVPLLALPNALSH